MTDRVIGLDIGGANIKIACASPDEVATSLFFPLWQKSDDLASTLEVELRKLQPARRLAVTMTGELADCFRDRAEGVGHIVDAVELAASNLGVADSAYYGVDGGFHEAKSAKAYPDLIAAANWHALASLVGQKVHSNCLLVDIGSTTTDIIPITNGRVATEAMTDLDRLAEGSLVYLGCDRTPLCSLVRELDYRSQRVPVMKEVFATTADVMLVLGFESESEQCDTADGQPRTKECARNRIARMVGLDHRKFSMDDALCAGKQVLESCQREIGRAMKKIEAQVPQVAAVRVASGHGQVVLPGGYAGDTIQLLDRLGRSRSRCAPAFAVAELLSSMSSR